MSHRYVLTIGFLLVIASAFTSAHARDEMLSFRLSPNGGFQAVISGLSDGPGCVPEFTQPSSVQVTSASIVITSPLDAGGCSLPQGLRPYEVTAELGALTEPSYQVAWVQGQLQLTGVLILSQLLGTPAVPLPALTFPMLVALCLGLFVAGLFAPMSVRRLKRGSTRKL